MKNLLENFRVGHSTQVASIYCLQDRHGGALQRVTSADGIHGNICIDKVNTTLRHPESPSILPPSAPTLPQGDPWRPSTEPP
jgi:hypothetical protein